MQCKRVRPFILSSNGNDASKEVSDGPVLLSPCMHVCPLPRPPSGLRFRPRPSSPAQCAEPVAAVKDAWVRTGRCPYRHPRPVLSTTKARARPTHNPIPIRPYRPSVYPLLISPVRGLILSCKQRQHTDGRTRTRRGATRRRRRRGDPPLAGAFDPGDHRVIRRS